MYTGLATVEFDIFCFLSESSLSNSVACWHSSKDPTCPVSPTNWLRSNRNDFPSEWVNLPSRLNRNGSSGYLAGRDIFNIVSSNSRLTLNTTPSYPVGSHNWKQCPYAASISSASAKQGSSPLVSSITCRISLNICCMWFKLSATQLLWEVRVRTGADDAGDEVFVWRVVRFLRKQVGQKTRKKWKCFKNGSTSNFSQ